MVGEVAWNPRSRAGADGESDMALLGEILVAHGACTPEQVQRACEHQAFYGGRIGTSLLELGVITEEQLARALQALHGVRAISGDVDADPQALALLDRELVERYQAVPYLVTRDRRLVLLVCDPRDVRALDDIAFATGKRVIPVVVPQGRLWTLMQKHYGIERVARGCVVEDIDHVSPTLPVEPPRTVERRPEVLGADLIDEDEFSRIYVD